MLHTGETPHKCNVWKMFRYVLKRHCLVHTGEKPNKCNICGKRYSTQWYLNQHNLIHVEENPHGCKTCGKCLTGRDILRFTPEKNRMNATFVESVYRRLLF